MNLTKTIILFSMFFVCCKVELAYAQQYTITGKVIDGKRKPVEFAHASLLRNDILYKKASTDSLGTFSLNAEKGSYVLILEQFGKEHLKQKIEVVTNAELGELQIDGSILIEGVSVIARRKMIEQKIDRTIFNVENSIVSQGMSGLDALKNSPLVRVQNDNISIVGKGGVSIMINERMVNLSGSELTNYLQSLRSEDISKIEVITTPPSKYEAQGNSGIINIVMKKNPNLGWSGNINSSYQRNSYNGFRTGATINYKSHKISTSLKIRQYDLSFKPTGTRDLIGSENSVYTNETRKDQARSVGVNYNFDYKINDRQNIGFIYDFNTSRYSMVAEGVSIYKTQGVIDSSLITVQKQLWKTPTHTLNVYYDIKLDTVGKKLSFTANYLGNRPDKANDFNTANILMSSNETVRNISLMNYKIYSGQADLLLPFKTLNIEAGAKYTLFENNSDVKYYTLHNSDYVINSNNSNVFNYKEQNFATYISVQKDFNNRWSAKAGLRYEYTALEGNSSNQENGKITNNYGKVFPTAYLSFKPDDNHAFSLNYAKRISRPDFQDLNPFRWYTNPYMYFAGTPSLRPSYNDNVELSYSFKGKLTAALYNEYSRDNTSSIARLENGIFSNIVENSYDQNKIGVRLGYYDTFFGIWESSISSNANYAVTTPNISEVERLKLFSFSYSIYNTITLNKEKTWFLMLNFWHDLPFTYANVKMKDQLDFSPGVKASFLGKRLNISAVFSDVFRTLKNQGYSYNNGYRSEFYSYNDYRKFSISMAYAFGNRKVKGTIKTVEFDESSRAN